MPYARISHLRALATLLLSTLAAPGVLCAQRDVHWAKADSVVALGKARLGLGVYAWRDFMPPRQEGNGSDLRVNLKIVGRGTALPPGLVVDSAWVRSAAGLWATTPTTETRRDLRNGLDLMLRGGPKWATGKNIEVLIKLRLPSGEVGYLLLQSRINETS